MAGSVLDSAGGRLLTTDTYMSEDSKSRLMKECLRKRAELMHNARSLALASADCNFEWTFISSAKKIPGAKNLMEYGAKAHQVKHWDTLDLGTLSRAIDKGHVQVRAWDDVPLNGAQPSQKPGFQKKLDFCTRCIRLVDATLGRPLSWDAYGPETNALVKSFSKPFELRLRNQCLYWQFTTDYPAFPSVPGGFKNWSDEETQECDNALKDGQLSLVPGSAEIRSATPTTRPASTPTATVPALIPVPVPVLAPAPTSAEPMSIPRSNNAGSNHLTPRNQTPVDAQPASGHTQPGGPPPGGYTTSERSQSGPPIDILSQLNKQTEEISTLQNQLKRVQTQAANSHSKIQALQLELDVAKSGLRQSEKDVIALRTEVQDMKDFINTRSTVTCNLEFLTENLKERMEQLESLANSAPQGLGHHTPEPTESLPEILSTVPEAPPMIKSENLISTPLDVPTLVPDSRPIETMENARRSLSNGPPTSSWENDPNEDQTHSESDIESSNTAPHIQQDSQPSLKEPLKKWKKPSRGACLKELGMSQTIKEGEHTNKISLISTIYENWGGFPSKILPQKMFPRLGHHQHVLRKLAKLSSKVPRGIAIRLLQKAISKHDKRLPTYEVITKRELDKVLAQALEHATGTSSVPHQDQDATLPANSGDDTDTDSQHTPSQFGPQGSAETKKRRLSEEGERESPRKRLRSNNESNIDNGSSS